jgi:glycosyltransferase involved in cell wall biosynthesis
VTASESLVSVVTPAYNEESHIRECIESVLAQTHHHWDYTIIDNASTDRTHAIAQEYAAKDARIRIVRNEATVPVIANYNIAFRQVSPDARYCKVVAADDWIYPECLSQMAGLADANPRVGLVGAYSLSGTRVDPAAFPFPTAVVPGRDVCRSYLSRGPHLLGAASSLLYRADIVRSRKDFFRTPDLHSDAAACLELLEHDDYGFVHQVLTFTRVREESLTSESNRNNVYIAIILEFLLRFGPKCFSERELAERIDDQLQYYYHELGRQTFRNRGPEFWEFQRRRLAELGHPLSRLRLTWNALLYGLEALASKARRLG